MIRMKFYREILTAVDGDILAGSELEFAPGAGVYVIRAASTVSTATLQVTGADSPSVSSLRTITLRANGEVRAEDTPWLLPVTAGEKITIELAGTTGSVHLECAFFGGG